MAPDTIPTHTSDSVIAHCPSNGGELDTLSKFRILEKIKNPINQPREMIIKRR